MTDEQGLRTVKWLLVASAVFIIVLIFANACASQGITAAIQEATQ